MCQICKETLENIELRAKMILTREICAEGHRLRQEAGIPVKQPLNKVTINKTWTDERYKEIRQKLIEELPETLICLDSLPCVKTSPD